MIETILFIWIVLPIVSIFVLYLYKMGFSWPGELVESSEYKDVYSEDVNRIDEDGGPYKVKIKK
jgi:hypothetical protein